MEKKSEILKKSENLNCHPKTLIFKNYVKTPKEILINPPQVDSK